MDKRKAFRLRSGDEAEGKDLSARRYEMTVRGMKFLLFVWVGEIDYLVLFPCRDIKYIHV
jgi:hypothetical protein